VCHDVEVVQQSHYNLSIGRCNQSVVAGEHSIEFGEFFVDRSAVFEEEAVSISNNHNAFTFFLIV
jgi:hypothetical protein